MERTQQGTYVSRGYIDLPERAPRPAIHRRAMREVDWFFGAGDAAMGLHAQAYGTGDGATVWDEDRINALHARHLTNQHADNVARHRRIAPLIAALSASSRIVLHAAVVPAISDFHLVTAFAEKSGHGSLAGVALFTLAAQQAYARKHAGQEPNRLRMIAFLGSEARVCGRPANFSVIAREARELVADALGEYEELRVEREGRIFDGEFPL